MLFFSLIWNNIIIERVFLLLCHFKILQNCFINSLMILTHYIAQYILVTISHFNNLSQPSTHLCMGQTFFQMHDAKTDEVLPGEWLCCIERGKWRARFYCLSAVWLSCNRFLLKKITLNTGLLVLKLAMKWKLHSFLLYFLPYCEMSSRTRKHVETGMWLCPLRIDWIVVIC